MCFDDYQIKIPEAPVDRSPTADGWPYNGGRLPVPAPPIADDAGLPMTTNAEHAAALDRITTQLAGTTNVGESGDVQDVYGVFQQAVDYLHDHFPPFACTVGCATCCHWPRFVSAVEWRRLHREILTLPSERQAAIIRMAEALRPLAPQFARHRQHKLQPGATPPPSFTAQCPLLLDGQCGAYAGRPLQCRTFGYTADRRGQGLQFSGSDLALAHLQRILPQGVALPAWAPFQSRVVQMNQAHTAAFIPQWIWAHVRDGAFVTETILDPDFGER